MTDLDRQAQPEVRMVCRNHEGLFRADDEKVVEADVDETFALARTGGALVALESSPFIGSYTTTNHWTSPAGDHFFAWGTDVGSETIVTPDRSGAVQLVWGPLSGPERVYSITPAPDGTTRPSGTPIAISACVPVDVAKRRKAEGLPVIPREGAEPVSSATVAKKVQARVNQCRRRAPSSEQFGEDIQTGRQVVIGNAWRWMPAVVVQDAEQSLYVSFSPRLNSSWIMYRVSPNESGELSFRLGVVSYKGRYLPRPEKNDVIVRLTGTPDIGTLGEVDCAYFFER